MVELVAFLLLASAAAAAFGFARYRAARPHESFPGMGWANAHHAVVIAFFVLVVIVAVLPQAVFGVPEGKIDFRSGLVISGAVISVLLLPLTIAVAAAATFVRSAPARWVIIAVVWAGTLGLLSLHLQAWLR